MPRLCGVNICLEKDQRSLASGFVGVKAKVASSSRAEESKSPPLFRVLPYNCLATSVVGLDLQLGLVKLRIAVLADNI